ncbi:MAG: hypothetical protein R2726_04920 [Acidimicrobiales bacterium]
MTDARLRRLDQVAGWAAVVLVAVPFVANAVVAAGLEWHPASDRAVILARITDVLGGDRPLVGAYSRFRFNHPGPLGSYLLAPAWALRSTPGSVLAACALLNGAAVLGAVALTRRRAGSLAAVGMAATLLLVARSMGPVLLRDPWNPWLPVLPFALFLVAAWAMATGSRWALPVAVGAGSFVVQEHIGSAAVLAAVGLWGAAALAAVAWRERPATAARPWLRPVLVGSLTAVVVLVAWAPPVRQQVTASPGEGNLSRLVSHFRDGGDDAVGTTTAGLGTALAIVGRQVRPLGPWLVADEPVNLFTGEVEPLSPWWVGLFVAAVAGAAALRVRRRRGRDPAVLLAVTVLVGAAAGVLAVARVEDGVFPYLIRWWWVLAAMGWFVVAWVVGGLLLELVGRDRPAPARAVLTAIAGSVLVGLVAVTSVQAADRSVPDPDQSRALAALVGPVRAAMAPGAAVRVTSAGQDSGSSRPGWPSTSSRRAARWPPPPTRPTSGDRCAGRDEPPPDRRLIVATGPGTLAAPAPPGYEVLATYDSLPASERAEAEVLRVEVDAAVAVAEARGDTAWGLAGDADRLGIPEERLARLADLTRRSTEAVVYRARAEAPG